MSKPAERKPEQRRIVHDGKRTVLEIIGVNANAKHTISWSQDKVTGVKKLRITITER